MKHLLAKRQVVLLLFSFIWILSGCGKKPQSQPECGFVQNVYGERISWKGYSPVPLYVHESFPAEMIPGLEKAIADWEVTLGHPAFKIVQTGYQSSGPRQDGVNVIYWLKTWETEKATEQARTSVYWLGDQIKEADIRVNAKNFTFYLDKPTTGADIHFESFLLHELGHVLGLKHKDDSGSIMSTYLASSTVRNHISEADKTNIRCEY
jgi:hypothetical protein